MKTRTRWKTLTCSIPLAGLIVAVVWSLGWSPARAADSGTAASANPKPNTSVVRLDDLTEGETEWTTWQVGNCQSQVAVVKDDPALGDSSLKFSAAITGAGDYCAVTRDLKDLGLADITAFHLRVKSSNVRSIATQLTDGTGQVHQTKGIPITADGQWHDLVIEPLKTNGGEHWGGANDGIWHASPAGISILLDYGSDTADHKPVLSLADIRADAVPSTVPVKDKRVVRLTFSTDALGHFWFPNDPRTMQVTVESTRPLLDAQHTVTCDVRDYWGAPQTLPAPITVQRKGKDGALYVYTGAIDLGKAPLEVGRYYEIHGFVPRPGGDPFTNYSSFAILPEAATHRYKPEEVPFTSRDWDGRIGEYIRLTDRIGVRVAGLWAGWSPTPPYTPDAPGLDIVEKAGQGWITGAESGSIEAGKNDYDEAALRGGVDALIAKFGKVRPMYISLGNEPSGTGEQVVKNVDAYRVVYDEVKKVDPTIFVVGTSIGPDEEYFKAGFGKYCDAYDFHTYAGVDDVRNAFAAYRTLMKKYGVVRPIWSTEMGMNSQGVARSTVASLMIKKFAVFFAEGGANAAWFDFLYPDGEGTNANSAGAAHDIFDSRYNLYAPKLTAVTYYDLVNAIAIKKFVAEKEYPDGVSAFLFRDRDGKSLQILWRDGGRTDIGLPLPGVSGVQVVLLDGSRRTLDARGKNITLSVGDEPVMLLYDGGPKTLADSLEAPAAAVEAPRALRGGASTVKVTLNGVPGDQVTLAAPPFWSVTKLAPIGPAGKAAIPFKVMTPSATTAAEATYTVLIGPAADPRGELTIRAPVAERLAVQVQPTPAMAGKPAGVDVVLTNNGAEPETVKWTLAVDQEQSLSKGVFGKPIPASATLGKAAEGEVTIAGGSTRRIAVPLAKWDPLKLYHVQAAATDAAGHTTTAERLVGGFAGAPRAVVPPKLDGMLDEPAWQTAPVQRLNTADQLHAIDPQMEPWTGPRDVSAGLRFLWDDRYLYVGVDETEAVGSDQLQPDDRLWAGNGLQFLVDPARTEASKLGYYDFSLGVGIHGPAAWMHSSADPGVSTGLAKDIVVSTKRKNPTNGDITYEVAIPWSRLAPFQPHVGADLGLSMAINVDHGKGRHGFMTWFGDVQDKSLDTVGDVILGP